MSGGHFNYDQYKIEYIADSIDDLILHNGSSEKNDWGDLKYQTYPEDIIDQFKIAANKLREAAVYAQRIDWLVSGDDGEESFGIRLESDLKTLQPYKVE